MDVPSLPYLSDPASGTVLFSQLDPHPVSGVKPLEVGSQAIGHVR
jgi:hypothetical protein